MNEKEFCYPRTLLTQKRKLTTITTPNLRSFPKMKLISHSSKMKKDVLPGQGVLLQRAVKDPDPFPLVALS